ncbi:glycoside hydrolase family 32 protein [Candidatus Cetobacterium colombiensis]|uniref:Sucrose-6-phosphate hydrolase n=1 Tax=Candidatus Cetobacterium colombiensis TaxID=3073100 RepID=A0ABU4W9G2_9FUSO|nr:sucrose-6-phosphate hydrolase [Candidatus Cetobacterium colombiensis]MDX8336165.1 sucrose-6-phosphate hydrolase [Candidatus Cetobacterium colombiensis]
MWKNKFHISPPYGLLNDPNGLIYWNNEYHIFYQWNPNACEHGAKSWAHLKSTDLVNWESMPVALSPTDWFDKNGCYSGSAIEKNGELYLFYTGNVKNNGIRESYQCLAISRDGITFEKKGPVIHDQNIPKEYTKHFRDPKVFIQNGIYKMVLGAQRNDLTGTIVIFSSKDLIHWEFEGEIIKENFGFMCECPDFIEDSNKKALIFSPQGIESKGYLYNNRYQSGYIIRDLFEIQKNKFIELDRGFEFYAPQTFKDEYNKNVLIGWIGMPEELDHPSVKSENWIHSLTLPRTLEIKENKILQNPHINLKKLRKNAIILENINFQDILDLSNYNIFGETYELIINFENFSGNIDINLRKNERQKTTFSYDSIEKKATLDRSLSGSGYKGVRSCYLENLEKIHIFVDKSTVEIFLNNGEEVFTGNIYPNNNSLGIEFKTNSSLCISKLKFYNL